MPANKRALALRTSVTTSHVTGPVVVITMVYVGCVRERNDVLSFRLISDTATEERRQKYQVTDTSLS